MSERIALPLNEKQVKALNTHLGPARTGLVLSGEKIGETGPIVIEFDSTPMGSFNHKEVKDLLETLGV